VKNMKGKLRVCKKGKYAYVRGESGKYLCRANIKTGELDGEVQHMRLLRGVI